MGDSIWTTIEQQNGWTSVRAMVTASKPLFDYERSRLDSLLKKSNKLLQPMNDPFTVDLGGHRWLKYEREEAYSDWLKWVLEQLPKKSFIERVMGMQKGTLKGMTGSLKIDREYGIRDIQGNRRRTDLDIRFGNKNAIRVEVKKGGAEDVSEKQLKAQEMEGKGARKFKSYLLLVSSGTPGYKGNFEVRYWSDICLALRRDVPNLKQLRLIQRALILAFVGAVEQNLLQYPGSIDQLIRNKQMIGSDVSEYLEKTQGEYS